MARRPGGAQRYKLESSALKHDMQRNNGVDFSAFVAVVLLLLATIEKHGTGRTMANARS